MTTFAQQQDWPEEDSPSHRKKVHKIASEYIEYGCGFPVKLRNVPMIEEQGESIPYINYNKLDKYILLEICKMPYRLTGNQVRYIRLYFEKTLKQFADILKVKHSSIIHWEKQKDNIAKITWGTELSIRLFVLYQLESDAKRFQQYYADLIKQNITEKASYQLDLDISQL
jgi:DNA-binding transcriptional regulator YiaG